MKGDFSRSTFDPAKHYSTVRMQQGRVQLDADWNEQADIARHRAEAEAAALTGGSGGPLGAAAFGIALDPSELSETEREWLKEHEPPFKAGADFIILPGRYFVDGALCECERPVCYTRQHDLPKAPAIEAKQKGRYLVYLDVWQRHLTQLEDPSLRETALGGPDTATRTKTVWQVKAIFSEESLDCESEPLPYKTATAPSSGRLAARAKREAAATDPCIVPESAGYRGLENQLYRVEVHEDGGPIDLTEGPTETPVKLVAADRVEYESGEWEIGESVDIFRSAPGSDPMEGWVATVVADDEANATLTLSAALPDLGRADDLRMRSASATYKWSRDNGSIVTPVRAIEGRRVTVAGFGPDSPHRLVPGSWVELTDEASELQGRPGHLCQLESVDEGAGSVTLRGEPHGFDPASAKLRHWDGAGALKRNPDPALGAEPFLELEDGVQISFSGGHYRVGDYWQIPARTATADARSGGIDWPVQGEKEEPVELPAFGVEHRYVKLAVLGWDGKKLSPLRDCRTLFPSLTRLDTLAYVGGDGQQAKLGQPLPQPLEVGVFRGPLPVVGARVRFEADVGGQLAADPASLAGGGTTFQTKTGADGVASCAWLPAPDLQRPSQRVEARALGPGGEPLPARIEFNAQLSAPAPAGGGEGWCRRVEPGEDLDEVLRELVSADEQSICVCLGAGSYVLGALGLRPIRMASLTILGSGPFTRLRANGEFTLDSFRSVRIADLELEMAGGKPLTFRQCGSVTLERCGVSKGDPSGIACAIESDRGTIVGSTLTGSGDESKPVLALDPNSRLLNGSTLIDHSVLAGSLVIGGRVPAKAPDPKTLATLPQLLASENLGPEPVGALHVRSSRIARLAVDQQALKSLGEKHGQAILRELSLTDTTVGGKDNLAVARRVLLNGGGLETGGEAGLLIGRTAVVSSIWGDAKTSLMIAARRVEGAANLIALFDPDGSEIPAP